MYKNQIEICHADNKYKRCLLTNGSGKKKYGKLSDCWDFLKRNFKPLLLIVKKALLMTILLCSFVAVLMLYYFPIVSFSLEMLDRRLLP